MYRSIQTVAADELKTLAIELQDLVQSKVGTTKFAHVYNDIRQKVLTVRRDRRTARVVQVCRPTFGAFQLSYATHQDHDESRRCRVEEDSSERCEEGKSKAEE